jgi:hypothetical protein
MMLLMATTRFNELAAQWFQDLECSQPPVLPQSDWLAHSSSNLARCCRGTPTLCSIFSRAASIRIATVVRGRRRSEWERGSSRQSDFALFSGGTLELPAPAALGVLVNKRFLASSSNQNFIAHEFWGQVALHCKTSQITLGLKFFRAGRLIVSKSATLMVAFHDWPQSLAD